MTNKLVVIRNSLKVPKIKKILLYEIKFLVPNYTCLRNPWLGGYAPRSPFPLPSVLKWICWTPAYEQNSWVRHCTLVHSSINSVVLRQVHSLAKSEFSTGWIFMKFDIWVFFENLSQKKNSSFFKIWQEKKGTLHEKVRTFMIKSRWIHIVMKNVSDKSCRENQNTHFAPKNIFRKSCRCLDNVRTIWLDQAGHRWQHNTALAHCMLDN